MNMLHFVYTYILVFIELVYGYINYTSYEYF